MNLQPLRIEAGWQVSYNQFYEVDPIVGFEDYFDGSSLLILKSDARLKLIDVQWRPEGDLKGEYQLVVVNFIENFNSKNNTFEIDPNWENPFLVFATTSRLKLVKKIEELMRVLPVYKDPRMTVKRGVVDKLSESYRIELKEKGISKALIKKVIEFGSFKMQNHFLDENGLSKEVILQFAEKGKTNKIKNKANQKLNSKKFK